MIENEIAIPEEKAVSVFKPKKRVRLFFRILVSFLLFCILLLVLWIGICWLQKVPARSVIPSDYSIFLHTDSAYDTFDPLLDLQVTDLFLSAPELRGARETVRELKNSSIRDKKSFRKITSRKTDIAFYSDESGLLNFVAAVDMGPYACLSRMTPLLLKFVKSGPLKDVEYVKDDSFLPYYQIKNDGAYIYFKPYKNLIIASSSMNLFTRALLNSPFSDTYTEEEKLAFSKDDGSLSLIVKPRVLLRAMTGSNIITREIDRMLSDKIPASISLDVSDSNIKINMSLPIDMSKAKEPAATLLSGTSKVPRFGSNLNDSVTGYTLLNFASLYELKEAIFPLFPEELKVDEIWSGAQYLGKIMFGLKLDDILFSWSGKEMAVLGIKGDDKPVFALEVSDVEQMYNVFKKLAASPLVKSEFTKGKNGVKLQQIKLPSFVDKLLSLFKISLPSPFFFVQDGFAYFSQSAEALSKIYNSQESEFVLEKNVFWDKISEYSDSPSSISVYYNLSEKTPFFLQGDSDFVKALSLYSTGRCDISFNEDRMNISLGAFSERANASRTMSAFPIKTEGEPTGRLFIGNTKKTQRLFWTEDNKTVHSYDMKKMAHKSASINLEEDETLKICVEPDAGKKDSLLWCVTSLGNVYLLNGELEVQKGFPVSLGAPSYFDIDCNAGTVFIVLDDCNFAAVGKDASVQKIKLPFKGGIQSKPVVLGKSIAVYDRTYTGSIYIIEDGECINIDDPIKVDGIGSGCPALVEIGGKLAVSFITEDGLIHSWWSDGKYLPAFPISINGKFKGNLSTDAKNLYAISDDARIYRISYSGNIDWKKIPDARSEDGMLSTSMENEDFTLYATVNENKIYAFNSDLDLMSGYPVKGFGTPLMLDIDKDDRSECVAISSDREINAFLVD